MIKKEKKQNGVMFAGDFFKRMNEDLYMECVAKGMKLILDNRSYDDVMCEVKYFNEESKYYSVNLMKVMRNGFDGYNAMTMTTCDSSRLIKASVCYDLFYKRRSRKFRKKYINEIYRNAADWVRCRRADYGDDYIYVRSLAIFKALVVVNFLAGPRMSISKILYESRILNAKPSVQKDYVLELYEMRGGAYVINRRLDFNDKQRLRTSLLWLMNQ
jgi:hypothetical protein